MTDDDTALVERLRKRLRASRQGTRSGAVLVAPVILSAAADALEAAQTENTKLREALEFYRDEWEHDTAGDASVPGCTIPLHRPTEALDDDGGKVARKTLENGND